MELKAFKQAVGGVFREAAFANKGQTWYADHDGVVIVVNLQKSQYSAEHFLNLGFWLKAVGTPPATPPSEHLCHVRIRAESLFPEVAAELAGLLNIESDIPDDDRAAALARILTENVIPFLKRGTSPDGLRDLIREGYFRGGLTHVDARRLLGV